jgi:pilus assembly protein TadC
MTIEENIRIIKESVFKERKLAEELSLLLDSKSNEQERKMIDRQIEKIRTSLKKTNDELKKNLEQVNITKPIASSARQEGAKQKIEVKENAKQEKKQEKKRYEGLSEIDKGILKRIKKEKGRKPEVKQEEKSKDYTKLANKLFSKTAISLIKQKRFDKLQKDLIKANLNSNLISYVSVSLLNTAVALGISFFLFIFLLFFNVSPTFPIVTLATEGFGARFLGTFWIIFAFPAITFLFMNFYPSLEKKSLGGKIDAELPFAAIHMAAISGSMVDPTKIFSIIASTKEYPNLEKEFNKLLNEINVYGYDLVTALKDLALNSSSQKLSELMNGLATTITSGGSLYDFFDKRSQSLLFEYRLEKEKSTKTAETFMDIYISVVIAAPMIFMLLLMMMKISGLGVSLSTSMITILVVGAVSLINFFFLMFLQLKQKSTG